METSLPITALGTANERLFIGMGNKIMVKDFNLQPTNNHSNSKLPIVGISATKTRTLFWSKNEIFVVSKSDVISSLKTIPNYSVLFTDGNLVLLRQNAILSLENEDSKILFCESNKLLYSGIIINSKNHANSLICAGTIQNEIEIWNNKNGKIIGKGRGHRGSIFCLNFNEERNELYSGSDDRSVRIWNFQKLIESGDCEPITLWGHTGRVWSVLSVENHLVSGGEDGIFIWSIINQTKLKFIPTRSSVWNLTNSNSCIFAGMENGEILKLDVSSEVIPNKTVIFPEMYPDNGTCIF